LVSAAMLGPIYAIFVEKVGGDILDASFAFGIFSFVAFLTTFFSGKYADKHKNNEILLMVGYLILAVGFLSYIFVSSVISLFIVQIIIGFGKALYAPAFDGLYSKYLDKGEQNTEWGLWEGTDYITQSIGAVIGGMIANYFGFNALFIIMGCLCFIAAFVVYKETRLKII
jgi:MFS family permease